MADLRDIPRFKSKITERGECHIWTGAKCPKGYPTAYWRGKTRKMHRIAYEIGNGSSPGDLHVCHRCDEPSCVNPSHLFLGTHGDNMRDAAAKGRLKGITSAQSHFRDGRAPFGERASAAALTEVQAREIIERAAQGERSSSLASEFRVTRSTIQRLLRGETWSHLPRPCTLPRPSGVYLRPAGRAALQEKTDGE